MAQVKHFGWGAVLAVLATGALADVTAEQVWADQERFVADTGYDMTSGSQQRQGDTLIVRDVVLTMEQTAEEAGGRVTITLDEIRLRETGDGRVNMTLGAMPRFQVTSEDAEGAPVEFGAEVTLTDYLATASGAPDNIAYEWTAEALTTAFSLPAPVGEDGAVAEEVDISLGMQGLTGTLARGEGGMILSGTTAQSLSYEFSGATDEGAADLAFTLADVALDQAMTPGLFTGTPEDLAAGLRDGGSARIEMQFGAASVDATMTDPEGQAGRFAGEAVSGTLTFAMDESGLSYGAGTQEGQFQLEGGDLPVPQVSGSYVESGTTLTLPLTAADAPQDYSLATRLVGLTLGDEIWEMFDTAGSFPRDPLTLLVDLSGTMKLDQDLMSEETWQTDAPPGQFESLNLNDLRISGVGAELTGNGSFTFDNTDTQTFDGFPRPQGSVTLNLRGGNALIDRLVAAGFIPADQAMGARMMLTMFARPAEGEDALTSTIEINEAGEVRANGQRIR